MAAAPGYYNHLSSDELPLWLMAPAEDVARRLGGELVEMGLAKCVL